MVSSIFLIFKLLICNIVEISVAIGHICAFSSQKIERLELNEQPQYQMVHLRGPGAVGQYIWAPMRIIPQFVKFNYSVDDESYSISMTAPQKVWDKVKDVINFAVKEIPQIVAVRRIEKPIHFVHGCIRNGEYAHSSSTHCNKGETCSPKAVCGHYREIDEKYGDACYVDFKEVIKKGEGFKDTDLVLFVTISNCGGRAAAAIALQCKTGDFARPTGGFIRFCYDKIRTEDIAMLRSVTVHEIFHVLLNPLIGTFYIHENGSSLRNTYTIVNRTWKSNKGTFRRQAVLSTLPAVSQFARDHFGCPDLEGAEADNDNTGVISQHRIDHFDQRLFPESIMSPSLVRGVSVSKFDLVVLNSTGWYRVNNSYKANELKKTKNKGCNFARMSCFEYAEKLQFKNALIYPYCFAIYPYNDSTCSPDHLVAEECFGSLLPITSRPEYDYGNMAGYSVHLKFCPVVTPRQQQLDISSRDTPLCQINNRFQDYNNKICVRITYNVDKPFSKGICYDYQCYGDYVELKVGASSFKCSKDDKGKKLAITKESELACPEFSVVCGRTTDATPAGKTEYEHVSTADKTDFELETTGGKTDFANVSAAGKTDSIDSSTGFAIDVIIAAVISAVLFVIVVVLIIIIVILHKRKSRINNAKSGGLENRKRKSKKKGMTSQRNGKRGKSKDTEINQSKAVGKGTKDGIDKAKRRKLPTTQRGRKK